MLWVKAFHVIFMVCWFAGLFYLPRLFVYHADAKDDVSNQRFKVMEAKLYFAITLPSALLTTICGLWLLFANHSYYEQFNWMHAKLALVAILWAYTLYCGRLVGIFKQDANKRSHKWFRCFNEVPSILLIVIVILTIVKP
ncbi:MAG: protoporphyrinogen oxidase HemJ [Coxiellaceae bacterium]|nr:protoporphyrinogen oxidase HemJ [Coxiellaceae bacterium]